MENEKAYIKTINDVSDRVNELEHLIYKGNGKPSLLVQISELQLQLTTLTNTVDTKFETLTEIINTKFEHMNKLISAFDKRVDAVEEHIGDVIEADKELKVTTQTNKTSVIVAVIACVGAVLANIIPLFIK